MKLSIVIMAHPSRKHMVDDLLKRLKAKVVWDERNNIWDTCRRSWLAHDFNSDYCLTIQEDSILCDDFFDRLKLYGDNIFSLYIGNRKRFKSKVDKFKPNGGILELDNIHHEIALIFPTKRVKQMIDFCDKLNPNDDKVINKYVTKNNLKVLVQLPTLIDHRNEGSLHNLNQSQNSKRKSIWFEKCFTKK